MTAPPSSSRAPGTTNLPDGRTPRPRLVVAVVCLCGIVVSVTQTLIIPLVPLLPAITGASAADASWAITATLLTGAVATPIIGRLGDMVGKRLMLLICLVAVLVGSVVAAVAGGLLPLVLGRGLQGMSLAAIPLGISILRDELPPRAVGPAVAKMSATMGVGGAIGVPLAALVAERTHWHVMFWSVAALALLCTVAVALLVPESPIHEAARFDLPGAVGLATGLTMLLLVITKGEDWGWGGPLVLSLLAGSLLVLLTWSWWELRRRAPLVDLRVSARPQVLFTNLASIGIGFAMYGMLLIPVQLMMAPTAVGHGMGLSMIEAGLLMGPSGLMVWLCSSLGARISAARGSRTSFALGAAVMGAGYLSALVLRAEPWQVLVATLFIGAGMGFAFAAMPILIMDAVPISETAAANGLNALMRSVGTSLSAAAISAVLAADLVFADGVPVPTVRAFTLALVLGAAATLVALGLTLGIPRASPGETRS